MEARAAERNIARPQRVFAHAVGVEDQRNPLLRPIQYLAAEARFRTVPAIGLPAVDDPWFNLQLVRGEPLNSKPVEKPRRVGRNIRRLVGPVVEVVIAEEADVRHKYSGVDVEPVIHIEVVAAVGFRKILVGATQVPLASAWAGVVARGRDTKHSTHGQDSAADILPVEVAAEADLIKLDFVGAEDFSRSADSVVLRMVEAAYKIRIQS